MKYRIISGVYLDKDEADKKAESLKGKCRDPHVVKSQKSNHHIVVLFETVIEDKAMEAFNWFKNHDISAGLQYIFDE